MKSDRSAYKETHKGSANGWNAGESYISAVKGYFKGKDAGITLYQSKKGDKKSFTEVK